MVRYTQTSAARSKKYAAKLSGATLPDQAAHFAQGVAGQVRIEQAVRGVLTRYAVTPIYHHFYMQFGKKLDSILRKHHSETALNEIQIEENKAIARGLDFLTLEDIKFLFIAKKLNPFLLDASLLDGDDVLV